MAEHHEGDHRLIEQYLAGLRRSIARRRDADAVVDELRDHLLAASEQRQRAGASRTEADQAAIDALGGADVVAASFRHADHGVPAVPTAFSRIAGTTGYVAAGAGTVAAAAFAIADRIEASDGYWSAASQAWGAAGAVATLAATMSLLVLLTGVVRRHGGLGRAGAAAIGFAALGALASVIAWAVPVWGTLTAASWIVLAVAVRPSGLAPRHAATALAAALTVIPVAALASDGGPTALLLLADVVAIGVAAAAAVVLGRWLASEQPLTASGPLAAA
jgi:hypothetical protein